MMEREHSGRASGQAGLTLVELMVAMVISTILIYFILGVQTQMSTGFRAQVRNGEAAQTVQSARYLLARHLRLAGHLLPDGGVSVAPGVDTSGFFQALSVTNNADGDGPDSFRVLYADLGRWVRVDDMGPVWAEVDDPDQFVLGEQIIVATASQACLIEVTVGTNPNHIHFNPNKGGTPFNHSPQNQHCDDVRAALSGGEDAYIYPLRMVGFRLDPARPFEGVLQMSGSGGVNDDWVDLGIGFTNLQLATRFYEEGDTADLDGDGDPERDWYSSENQESVDPTGTRPANAVAVQVHVSIEGRNVLDDGQNASLATPAYIDLDYPSNNRLGDWGQDCAGNPRHDPCGVDLLNTPAGSRPARYTGDHIYRSSSVTIDFRNLGVGS